MIAIIPLYILGLLQRYGPMHGYQLKKTVGETISDFTQVKLPTIYYHLEKMRTAGLLSASSDKPGGRPEKTTYAVTEKGAVEFHKKLRIALDAEYRPVFPLDGAFFFADSLDEGEMSGHLASYAQTLKDKLEIIRRHREETLRFVPESTKKNVTVIFSHHEHHYQAELEWVSETLEVYGEVKRHGKTEGY